MKQVERAPTNNLDVHRRYRVALYGYAMLCLGTGDTNGYRATAAQIVAHLERRVGGNITLVAWACALAPDAVTNYAPLLEVVSKDLAGQTNTTSSLYGLQALGALLYRAGRYPEAARRLTELHELGLGVDPKTETTAATHGAYFLALTHARLGHTNEASEWLQRASALDPFAGGAHGPAASKVPWWNRLTLQLLRKEADSVLNTRPSQTTSPR